VGDHREHHGADHGSGPGSPRVGSSRSGCLGRLLSYFLIGWVVLLGLYILSLLSGEPETHEPAAVKDEPAATAPPRGYNALRDVHDSVEAAKLVDRKLIDVIPELGKIVAFVDVSQTDGHLMVHFKDVYTPLPMTDKRPFEELIADLWRSLSYVKDRGWSPNLEIVEHDGDRTTSRTIRP
jgi:hypothetical protein